MLKIKYGERMAEEERKKQREIIRQAGVERIVEGYLKRRSAKYGF